MGLTVISESKVSSLEQVDAFVYLGSLITEAADCTKEIRARLGKGKGTMASLKNIWKNHGISVITKTRLMKALIWPVATYGCEGWTIKKSDEKRINGFEMRGLRQILRVSWAARTNELALEQIGIERQL